jgi:predicted nucleotidyltransferase
VSERPSSLLDRHREDVRRVVASHGLSNPRVFGSVARGEDGPRSDIDIMVDVGPGTTGFDLGGTLLDLVELLGVEGSLVTSRQVPESARVRVFGEAVPI